jgi:hypothetical protein
MQYTNNQDKLFSYCNSITFVNTGTSNALIGAYKIIPGAFLSIPGNLGEIDITQYSLSFSGSGVNNLTIIRKSYV